MADREKKRNKISIKNVVACGIGTALFVVLTEVQIPIGIPNTSLQPRMAVLAFLSAIFGPATGAVIGLLGHALGDALYYGSVWWSWVFPEAVVGIAIGAFARKFAVSDGGFTKGKMVLFNIVQVIANAVAWIIVAPVLDIAVYAEPATKYSCRAHLHSLETSSSSVFSERCFWRPTQRSPESLPA